MVSRVSHRQERGRSLIGMNEKSVAASEAPADLRLDERDRRQRISLIARLVMKRGDGRKDFVGVERR
jgi:hypothetical protein